MRARSGPPTMDPKAGIWFSLGEDGSSAPVDDSLAALPYGSYTMTELRCEANEGLELITRSFWIERDSTVTKAVWMGLDDQEGPRISTTAKDGADGDKDVSADAEAKVVDAVAYEGLKADEEYELSATLVDQGDRRAVADASGMPWRPRQSSRPRSRRAARRSRSPSTRACSAAATWSCSRACARTEPRWRRTRTSPTRARPSTSPSRWARGG